MDISRLVAQYMRGRRKIVCLCIYVILCVLPSRVKAQYDFVFNVPYPQRYEAINTVVSATNDSVQGFRIANALLEKAKQSHNERDILSIEQVILALDQLWRVDFAHFEQKSADIIKRAEKINCHPVVAYVYQALGDYYYKTHNYSKAFEYYLRAYNDYHNLYKNEFPDMSQTQYFLALSYYRFYDYRSSLKYAKELINNDYTHTGWLAIFINDLVGTSYLKLKEYDSSRVYFQKTYDLAPLHHNPNMVGAWRGIATGKIGTAWYEQNKYDAAIPYLKKGVELTTIGKVPDNTASFSVYLADIYTAEKKMDSALCYLEKAKTATYAANKLENYRELYSTLSAYYRVTGNTGLTLKYLDSTLKFKDSIAAIIDVNKKYKAELEINEERRNKMETLAAKEKQRQVLLRNEMILIVVVIMVFVLLFYNRTLIKQRYRRQQLNIERKIYEAELANAVLQLDTYKNSIAEKNEVITLLEKEITESHDPTTITKLQQSTILTDEQWEEFRRLFEKAHPGFLQKLKEKLHGLSPAEIRFMVLAKLNFTNKEMAAALGVSSQAIRTTWYRLRKKLNLPEESSIEDLVEKI